MKTLIKGAIAGGLTAFIWTNISWMVLPWHWTTLGGVENEAPLLESVKANIIESGVYILPYSDDHSQESQQKIHKKMADGPYAFMAVHPKGVKVSMGRMMVVGLLTNIIVALILTLLLKQTSGLNYVKRAGFVCLAGTAGAAVVILANWNWWNFPLDYTLVGLADTTVTWALAGLAIAKFCD